MFRRPSRAVAQALTATSLCLLTIACRDEEQVIPPATVDCQTDAHYSDRWASIARGGPSIGPVTLALGRSPETGQDLSTFRDKDGKLNLKLLILADVQPGTRVVILGRSKDSVARFTHFDGDSWALAKETAEGVLENRGSGEGPPVEAPGAMLVEKEGCYQLSVSVGGEPFGSFGVLLQP